MRDKLKSLGRLSPKTFLETVREQQLKFTYEFHDFIAFDGKKR